MHVHAIQGPASRGATPITINCEALFKTLTQCWKEDPTVRLSSNPRAPLRHPAYDLIIKLGSVMVPHILRDYAENGGRWAAALTRIVGESPVKPEHRGKADKVRDDWLAWGRKHGHLR
ncbi:MAG: hypothetical protein ABSE73_06815 [Planctomycetota bacterium]